MQSFLQSPEWEAIQRCYGRETRRISIGADSILCIKNDLGFGWYYWYSPRPLVRNWERFFQSARGLATEALFFRIEPLNEISFRHPSFALRSSSSLQPNKTVLIDLLNAKDELLAAMHPKTRYNIRLAERHGVSVMAADSDALGQCYALLRKTADRDKFSLHPRRYYECLLRSNSQAFENRLFLATYREKAAAVAMVNFYQGTATYLHGASHYELRNVMASHALHWGIMNAAKARGCHTYDLGGIDEARWPGLTRFKQGFGGELVTFPPAADVIFRPFLYRLYRLHRAIRGAP